MASFAAQSCHLLITQETLLAGKQCFTGKFKLQNQFFVRLLSHSWDLDQTGSDPELFPQDFHGTQRMCITSWAVCVLFLIVKTVNVVAEIFDRFVG